MLNKSEIDGLSEASRHTLQALTDAALGMHDLPRNDAVKLAQCITQQMIILLSELQAETREATAALERIGVLCQSAQMENAAARRRVSAIGY